MSSLSMDVLALHDESSFAVISDGCPRSPLALLFMLASSRFQRATSLKITSSEQPLTAQFKGLWLS